uniref:Tetraspanin-7 n=1 Tax=Meleagris gallopavo TaxID=9103 RepID=A0A803YIT0_MELGA
MPLSQHLKPAFYILTAQGRGGAYQGYLADVSGCNYLCHLQNDTSQCHLQQHLQLSVLGQWVMLPLVSVSTQAPTCQDIAGSMITGVILLAVGVWGKLIGTGTTIIVFGLFGCFATCRGSPWMLKLYAMFLSLVFLAELVAGISGFVFRHEIKDTFLRTYTEAIQNYNKNDERSHAVDNVQESLSCCGIQSYTNWSTSPYFFKHGIPTSCCMNSSDCNTQDLRNMTVAATKVNQKGCYDLVTSFMETNMGIIAGVAFGIAFSQLIGMLLACCLSRFITANQYEMV